MRAKNLAIALGVCGAFALWPSFVWLLAQFGFIGDQWFATGGAVAYTFPIALALAAGVFVVHGMALNAELAETLEARYASDPGWGEADAGAASEPTRELATVGAARVGAPPPAAAPSAAAEAGTATDEPEAPALGGKMAVAPRPKGFGDDDAKGGKKKGKVKKVGRQVHQRAGYKAKNAVTRGIRERLGLRF